MNYSFDVNLVLMSLVVATMASYTALDLAGRVAAAQGRAARGWLLGGALAMGAGIWSMHFIGMLAVKMPIPLGYDPALTGLSLLIAVVTSGFALALVSGATLDRRVLLCGGVIMGAGVCGMHYTGMAAMRMQPPIRYDHAWFAASVLIAIGASIAALWLAFTLRASRKGRGYVYKLLAAVTMGLAISGMHYSGMAAAQFDARSICTAAIRLKSDSAFLGHSIGVMVLLILSLTVLTALFDARMEQQTERMLAELRREVDERARAQLLQSESEERNRVLLHTTTDAVLLVDEKRIIHYANPTVQRVFGHNPESLLGRDIAVLEPERLREGYRASFEKLLSGTVQAPAGRVTEFIGRRDDGSEFPFELALNEVMLEGRRMFAGFIRDVTRRKEREARIARLNRMHTVLSRINTLIVQSRGRQELFEGACRIAVEDGRLAMAMIALVEDGAVKPVAVHGVDDGFVEAHIRRAAGAPASSAEDPVAAALRDGSPHCCNDIAADDVMASGACHTNCGAGRRCNDIAADPALAPLRDAALARGYRACAAFPLTVGERLVGCLALYAAEAGFFDHEELDLLQELAGDLSHSLQFIAHHEQLDFLSYYDPLTHLANRKLFTLRLEQYLDEARAKGGSTAVLVFDLARFRAINQLLGEAGGDEVLRLTADRLVGFAGDPKQAARLDADRFALVLPGAAAGVELVSLILQQLLPLLGRSAVVAGQELNLMITAGVALAPADGERAEDLLRNAGVALAAAKSGGEAMLFYAREMGATISSKLSLESRLRQAYERREFVLHYQPKLALGSGAICGAEALIRWNSPDSGLVPPAQFVPMLEATGIILPVGRWALRQALADRQEWLAAGLAAPTIAINVSALQLRDAELVDWVRTALRPGAGDAAPLELEITESVLMHDIERHLGKLGALRELGVRLTIDDFGTGYSSLAYLSRLPIAELKIDRSFILKMTDNADTMNIVSTIISLAHSMGLQVAAEGVETAEQLRFLRLLRCDGMQGLLFSAPLPARKFAELLSEGRRLAA